MHVYKKLIYASSIMKYKSDALKEKKMNGWEAMSDQSCIYAIELWI